MCHFLKLPDISFEKSNVFCKAASNDHRRKDMHLCDLSRQERVIWRIIWSNVLDTGGSCLLELHEYHSSLPFSPYSSDLFHFSWLFFKAWTVRAFGLKKFWLVLLQTLYTFCQLLISIVKKHLQAGETVVTNWGESMSRGWILLWCVLLSVGFCLSAACWVWCIECGLSVETKIQKWFR